MRLIVISPSREREHETRIVKELFEHGLETYHLRKPSMTTREMREFIDAIPEHFHNRIVVHSHHGLAGRYKLKGVHLTRLHIKRRFSTWLRLRRLTISNPGFTLSTSFNKIGHLYENKKHYDYVLLGTIFDAVSGKINVGYNEHSLRAALEKTPLNVIARGGTSADNVERCYELGFSGMAFYSGVWKSDRPVEAFCSILTKCRALNLTIE